MLKCVGIFFLILIYGSLFAQPGIYSEMDIEIQNKFMDAQFYKFAGDQEKQIKCLEELIKLDQQCHSAYYELSRVYYGQENSELAIKYAQKAYDLETNEWYALALAEAYESEQYFDKSSEIYKILIRDYPDNLVFYHRLAFAQQIQGKGLEAVSTFNKLEAIEGITESVSKRKFEIYSNLKLEKEAATELEKLSVAYPQNLRFMNNLASYYERIGNHNKAIEIYKRVLEIDPSDSSANMAMVQDDFENIKDDQYLHAITPLIENMTIPLDAKIKELIPYVVSMKEDPQDPINQAIVSNSDKLVNLYPKEAKVYALRGDVYYNMDDNASALKAYKKAISLNDNIFSIWNKCLSILYELANYVDLESYAYEAIDFFPNQFDGYFFMGLAFIGQDKYQELEDHLLESGFVAGKDKSNLIKYNSMKALHSLSINKSKEALDMIANELETKEEEYPYVFEIYGDIYSANAKDKQAEKYWKAAYKSGNRSISLKKKLNQKKLIE